jgi:TRAP-type uncharacterized transport system fused permease subunit
MTAARLGIVIYFIPVFFLFEPALIFQGPLWRTAVWTVLNIAAIVMIAGASEGYMTGFGRLRTWARPVLFIAGLLIGFPNLITTALGVTMLGVVVALRKLALVPAPAPSAAS